MAITSIKNLKEFSTTNERFEGAHLLCPGCAHSMIVRELMNCTDDNLVLATNTGCLEVSKQGQVLIPIITILWGLPFLGLPLLGFLEEIGRQTGRPFLGGRRVLMVIKGALETEAQGDLLKREPQETASPG